MDLRLVLIVISVLSMIMSLISIKKVQENYDSDGYYHSKIKMEIDEIKKHLKKQELKISYDQAISDILAELPEGSAKVIEDINNTVVIRINKDALIERKVK